jgi:hypothetical protein
MGPGRESRGEKGFEQHVLCIFDLIVIIKTYTPWGSFIMTLCNVLL